MSDLLIQNCHVLQIDALSPQAKVLYNHDILVTGQRIEAVLPTGQADPANFREVIQANEQLAIPGLINTHAHMSMALFRGLAEDVSIDKWFNEYIWPLENNLQPDDVYWGAQLGIAEMLENGVTTVADHYFYMDKIAKVVEHAGTRALLGWTIFSSSGLESIERTGAFAQRWNNSADGRIRTIMAPHAPYTCDDDFLRATALKAEEIGVGVHIHAAEEMGQTKASLAKRGQTPIQVLEETQILRNHTIIAHGCGLLPEDITLLAKYHTGIACAPKTYLKLGMDMTPVVALREAGIPVGLATDGPVSNNTLDILEALRLMTMLQKDRAGSPEVLPVPEALYIATRGSAAVLGWENELGALEVGYLADIALLDFSGLHHQPLYNPMVSLVYNAQGGDVQTVVVNGKVIMKDRQLKTLDKAQIITEVRSRMQRLSQRNPDQRIQTYAP